MIRVLGGVAVAGVLTKVGATIDDAVENVNYVGTMLGFAGGAGMAKALSKYAGKQFKSKIGGARLNKEERREVERIDDSTERIDRQIELQHTKHVVAVEQEMKAAALDFDLSSESELFLQKMIGKLEQSVDEAFDTNSTWRVGVAREVVKTAVSDRIKGFAGDDDLLSDAQETASSAVGDLAAHRVSDRTPSRVT